MARSRHLLLASALALPLALASSGGLGASSESQAALQPTYLGTAGLETALAELDTALSRDDGPALGRGPTLELGDHDERVAVLRARLVAGGEAPPASPPDPRQFDAALDAGVRAFQRRHGLEPDGKVGPATRAELDLGPHERRRQIEHTIAARRALPVDLGPRFLLLNLPAFALEAFDAGRRELSLRLVVGRVDRPTPTLSSAVRQVVVHPPWNVPPRIARQEIAARALRDPGYLTRLGFELFAGGSDGAAVDPAGVDWRAFQRGELALTLRQRPGRLNSLGAIAFQFPNPDNVALHDTPEKRLFERARRTFSHACMRVEHASELARWVLRGEPQDTLREFESALAGEATRELVLATPVPIYVVDWPVWVDAEGVLQMRPEVYPDGARRGGGECG